ncbi:hypothetical protein [Bacillus paranthracis]|uniref:hypothetical protein n=1 Tax=Bacillus paranthracis TaxID=2026186 RepID=UPI002D77B43B|nr:hypothetical protein [Bacillus paranthracis]
MIQGDIVFVQGKGIISNIVRYIDDNGKFSHCAIATSENQILEANIGIRVSIKDFNESEYDYVEVIDLGLTDEQRLAVYNRSLEYLGARYDYVQTIWYGLKKIFHLHGDNFLNNPKHFICSELVFIALEEAGILSDLGIDETYRHGIDLTPNQLYDLVKYISKNRV